MKTKNAAALLASMILAAPAFAGDQQPQAKSAEKPAAAAATHEVTAEVVSVDATAKTVTLKGEKGNQTVPADEKVFAQVKVGKVQTLVCQDDAKGGHKVASVKAEAAKPAEKPAEKK